MRVLAAHYFLKILYGTKKLNTWDYLFYLDCRPRVCSKVIYDDFSVLSVLACRGEMMGSGVELWEERGLWSQVNLIEI